MLTPPSPPPLRDQGSFDVPGPTREDDARSASEGSDVLVEVDEADAHFVDDGARADDNADNMAIDGEHLACEEGEEEITGYVEDEEIGVDALGEPHSRHDGETEEASHMQTTLSQAIAPTSFAMVLDTLARALETLPVPQRTVNAGELLRRLRVSPCHVGPLRLPEKCSRRSW